MSTFYVLPPRPLVGRQLAQFLQGILPDLDWSDEHGVLAEAVAAAAGERPDVYVVFREDLPEGVPLPRALVEDFGAAPGDVVVEASGGRAERWRVLTAA